jgi:hypothetical protein
LIDRLEELVVYSCPHIPFLFPPLSSPLSRVSSSLFSSSHSSIHPLFSSTRPSPPYPSLMAPSQRRQQRYADAYNDDEHHLFSSFTFDQTTPPLPVPVHVDAASYYFPSGRGGGHGHGYGHGGAPSWVERPDSSRSMPMAGRHQKKLKQMASSSSSQAMTGEEFDALPLAVRRKVRAFCLFFTFSFPSFSFSCSPRIRFSSSLPACLPASLSAPNETKRTNSSFLLLLAAAAIRLSPLVHALRNGQRQFLPLVLGCWANDQVPERPRSVRFLTGRTVAQ